MKPTDRALCLILLVAFLAPAVAGGVSEEAAAWDGERLRLIRPEAAPKGLVLFLPGAAGWDAHAQGIARAISDRGYLVAGIDWQAPGDATCWELGTRLADLAHWLAARESLPKGDPPILLGDAEGASLVYAAVLQSPPRRFHAAISLDFCPRWPGPRPPCSGTATDTRLLDGEQLRPAPEVATAWFLFDEVPETGAPAACPDGGAGDFSAGIGNARMAGRVAAADGDDANPLLALFQWLDPRIHDQVAVVSGQTDTAGLPLTEIRASADDPTTFAVMLSGDGGWAALDRGVTATLAAAGISTVGWDSLGYFWTARSPHEAAADLTRVLRHYFSAWHKERVILIGYSFGAEVLPFMINGLPPDLRARVGLAAYLGLSPTAMFEFHLSDWLNAARGENARPVLPELQQLQGLRSLCVHGAEEENSLCPQLAGFGIGIEVDELPGDHHFDDNYRGVAQRILRAAGQSSSVNEK